jgi:hypothetical protein
MGNSYQRDFPPASSGQSPDDMVAKRPSLNNDCLDLIFKNVIVGVISEVFPNYYPGKKYVELKPVREIMMGLPEQIKIDHGGFAAMTWSLCDHHPGFARMTSSRSEDHGFAMTCGRSPHHPRFARMTWSLCDHHGGFATMTSELRSDPKIIVNLWAR